MDMEPGERAVRIRADLLTAIVLVALGLTIVYLSWTMPRLEARHVHPATIPGLVPLLLGGALSLCGALLGLRARKLDSRGGWSAFFGIFVSRQAGRVGVVLALTLVYTLVLVGWLPFWAASMLFIFTFIMVFELYLTPDPPPWLRSAIWAAIIAVVAGGGIHLAFARIFLVRLP